MRLIKLIITLMLACWFVPESVAQRAFIWENDLMAAGSNALLKWGLISPARLPTPVPVVITYAFAEADASAVLTYYENIYSAFVNKSITLYK